MMHGCCGDARVCDVLSVDGLLFIGSVRVGCIGIDVACGMRLCLFYAHYKWHGIGLDWIYHRLAMLHY
jgi:hypothetical protein